MESGVCEACDASAYNYGLTVCEECGARVCRDCTNYPGPDHRGPCLECEAEHPGEDGAA